MLCQFVFVVEMQFIMVCYYEKCHKVDFCLVYMLWCFYIAFRCDCIKENLVWKIEVMIDIFGEIVCLLRSYDFIFWKNYRKFLLSFSVFYIIGIFKLHIQLELDKFWFHWSIVLLLSNIYFYHKIFMYKLSVKDLQSTLY